MWLWRSWVPRCMRRRCARALLVFATGSDGSRAADGPLSCRRSAHPHAPLAATRHIASPESLGLCTVQASCTSSISSASARASRRRPSNRGAASGGSMTSVKPSGRGGRVGRRGSRHDMRTRSRTVLGAVSIHCGGCRGLRIVKNHPRPTPAMGAPRQRRRRAPQRTAAADRGSSAQALPRPSVATPAPPPAPLRRRARRRGYPGCAP
jgi:hypothetical protein